MKTAEKILVTSLDLFNQHGESNVSSVDIAVELDISPGNLYYHFKGKEMIVAALFDLYKNQIDTAFNSATNKDLSIEEFFYFLYVILEKGHHFQFLFHNQANLAENYPTVAKKFKLLILSQERSIEKLIKSFIQNSSLKATFHQGIQIVELVGLVFTQSANYYALKGQNISDETHLYKGLATILFAVLPYINLPPGELHHLQEAIATQTLVSGLGVS
ncbi:MULTISPECIES: TetR/AcrR family transcriptional regulator [Alteromonadaceae]|uniref:TetR/AcrR family transcriptional regulator n=1 Tax=Alteromonadaceae TaxID=72275 RepID=UPI001C09B792|nr:MULTISPECIES: TetR/AcrR family transcriptional regulator [Aliiglaciecola]MBU2880084.1 TetR/AcrR family transcriptional regulator [Aliiglaciecola lipolytica]MDO6710918.1 TetR/AcrR family transcriptional regulator [Aliiglaciecola sp. 2_MG-2023]MDO6752399.1 TetR/AcrR family transcriptional regulator [Aliiglaciecola sp. 1_MG-2023]